MAQMSDNQKVRALALREGGLTQREVAAKVGYSVETTRRLEQASGGMKAGEVPQRQRKPGSGKKKSDSAKKQNAVLKAVTKNPKITCSQLLIRMLKTLGHLSRRTLNTILKEELKKKSSVAAIKPFLTESQRERKLAFPLGHRY